MGRSALAIESSGPLLLPPLLPTNLKEDLSKCSLHIYLPVVSPSSVPRTHPPPGPPSATNSHPHVSGANGEFVVVHNGIITNYAVLKPFLVRGGRGGGDDGDLLVTPFTPALVPSLNPACSDAEASHPQSLTPTPKQTQEKQGAVFVSETDTEVVPHLCEYLWRKKGGKVSLHQLVRGRN